MKNIATTLTMLFLSTFLFTFSGCKKGENDPFLSFRSRDARLAGNWELTGLKGESTSTSTFGTQTTITTTKTSYSSGEQTTIYNGGNPGKSYYKFTMEIDKKGELNVTYETFDSKKVSTGVKNEKGTWNWLNTAKRKSAIEISIKDPSNLNLDGIWDVDQLKNKEIIFKRVTYSKSTSSNSIQEKKEDNFLTFEGK